METVLYEREGPIAVISLNRPEALNALNDKLQGELRQTWDRFVEDDEALVAILTGKGRAFCSGMDLKEAARGIQAQGAFIEGSLPNSPVLSEHGPFYIPKPVIAAVNGPAAGGGLALMLSCDFAICSETAQFVLPPAARGLNGALMTMQLARRVGPSWAMWAGMSAARFDAQTALRIGLVLEVLPPDELMSRALEMAERIAKNSVLSVRAIKERVNNYLVYGWEKAAGTVGPIEQELLSSGHSTEGITAFSEKRRPQFDVV